MPGGIAVLAVGTTATTAPIVRFGDSRQTVVDHRGQWFALVGIPIDTAPGTGQITIEHGDVRQQRLFPIRTKDYPIQRLRLADQRMVEPPPELARRIAAERLRLAQLKAHFSAEIAPETRFSLPANGRRSSAFGVRRVFNGQARAPHSGLDIAVAAGQPVRAAAAGTVLATEDFYFAGQTVVIDHGQGLLTLYAHLSRVDVEVGQRLRPNEAIGLSGASGRATGPHLHWGVILGGSSVDPELFLASAR